MKISINNNVKNIPFSQYTGLEKQVVDYTESYLLEINQVLLEASSGSPEYISFLQKSDVHPYPKFRKIATKRDKLLIMRNKLLSISHAKILIGEKNLIVGFTSTTEDIVDFNFYISAFTLVQELRMLKIKSLYK